MADPREAFKERALQYRDPNFPSIRPEYLTVADMVATGFRRAGVRASISRIMNIDHEFPLVLQKGFADDFLAAVEDADKESSRIESMDLADPQKPTDIREYLIDFSQRYAEGMIDKHEGLDRLELLQGPKSLE